MMHSLAKALTHRPDWFITDGMPRKYRCPHCQSVESVEPLPNKAISVACTQCDERFRVPRSSSRPRTQTSHSQRQIRQVAQREAESLRSEKDQARLEQILKERRFGEYDILDELGRGGMGIVYKAFHRRMKRMVALKLILPEVAHKSTVLKRFQREAELHARLRHPNIVHVYDYGDVNGLHYIAMGFITGTPLTQLIGSPELTLRTRVDVVRQMADALGHAHDLGVLHRDIKPSNIIVDAGWNAHLVDFGVSKPSDMTDQETITRHGLAIGTPHYMAPEQFQPALGSAGFSSDIYSLGAVLYHVVAGFPPFDAQTGHEVLIKVALESPAPITHNQTPNGEAIPRDLAAIVTRAMEKNPAQRYESATAFADDLKRFLARKEVKARPLTAGERVRRQMTRNRSIIQHAAMVLGLMLVIIGAFVSVSLVSTANRRDIREEIAAGQGLVSESLDKHARNRRQLVSTLEKTQKHLDRIQEDMDKHARNVTLVYAIAGGISTFLTVVFGFFLILRRKRPERILAPPQPIAGPAEIGATADIVEIEI
jgi:serine/threonine protein kinase